MFSTGFRNDFVFEPKCCILIANKVTYDEHRNIFCTLLLMDKLSDCRFLSTVMGTYIKADNVFGLDFIN